MNNHRAFYLSRLANNFAYRDVPPEVLKRVNLFLSYQNLAPFTSEEIQKAVSEEAARRSQLHSGIIGKWDVDGISFWDGKTWTADRAKSELHVLTEARFTELCSSLYDQSPNPLMGLWVEAK